MPISISWGCCFLGLLLLVVADGDWFKSAEKMTVVRNRSFYEHNNLQHIIYEEDTSVNLTVPLSLLWRHCYNRRAFPFKKENAPRTHDVSMDAWSSLFSRGEPPRTHKQSIDLLAPIHATKVLGSLSSKAEADDEAQRRAFKTKFGVDPKSLDVHDYTSNFVKVSIRFLEEQCVESSLPFYFPWLMIDESDVVLVDVKDERELKQRIERNCPPPSHPHACLIFLRTGQAHRHAEKVFVLESLLKVMESRKQRFVLTTAWQEIWCTPYGVQPSYVARNPKPPQGEIREATDKILASPLLVEWWAKNPCLFHPKMHPLPLGPKREPNAIKTYERMAKKDMWLFLGGHRAAHLFEQKTAKNELLAPPMFEISTTGSPAFGKHRDLRPKLMQHLEKTFGEAYVKSVKELTKPTGWPRVEKYDALSFFDDIKQARFNYAPVGAAIDSHRAWESMMLGTIPIVFNTTLNEVFDGLPALILDEMEVTNPQYLEKTYQEMKKKKYDWDRLYGFYWIERVRKATYPREHSSGGAKGRGRREFKSELSEKKKELLGILDSLRVGFKSSG